MKKWMLLLLLIGMTGCSSKYLGKSHIDTIIEEEKNILIGINYPITNVKSLDSLIQDDIDKIYYDFKKEYGSLDNSEEQAELNIDYTYEVINERYINVTIHIFINSSTLANPNHYMKSYVYDIKQKKSLTIHDIIDEESFSKFIAVLKIELLQKYKECILLDEFKSTITETYDYPLFTLDYDCITLYFNPSEITASYCDILEVSIPTKQLHLKIPITQEEETNETIHLFTAPKVIDPNHKVVALTFDDGPSKYTEEILEILNENNACATFFVIGNKVEMYKETMQKMVLGGNEIGNHSYNHKWLTKLTEEDLKEQITKTQDIIYAVTGYTPTIIRPTYGSISNQLRKQLPLDIIMWTVDTRDWEHKSVNLIVKEATENIKDLDIILMHDTHKRTVDALKKIIPELQKQGFEFVTISELKEIKRLREAVQ